MADQNKTEKATPRRRQKAREQGQVARSRDLVAGVGTMADVAVAHGRDHLPRGGPAAARLVGTGPAAARASEQSRALRGSADVRTGMEIVPRLACLVRRRLSVGALAPRKRAEDEPPGFAR